MFRGLTSLVVGLALIASSFPVAAAQGDVVEEPVRIMVALKSSRDIDFSTDREVRKSIRDVRRMSRQAPRSYRALGKDRITKDMNRWRVIEVEPGKADELLTKLNNNSAVEEAYFERVYEVAVVPNDIRFSEQYGLSSNVQPLADINAPAAWDVTTGSSDTVIAVLDGGVDLSHEDLKDKIWVNQGEVAGNGVDDDGNGFVDDVHGWDFVPKLGQPAGIGIHKHATHVAGIVAASGNNGIGVAGVDWGARIMSVRVLGSSGVGREEGIVRGIEYATANGADVINMSIAGLGSTAITEAIEQAYAAGVVVVAAAGNNGFNTNYAPVFPVCADLPDLNMVLGVGATNDEAEPTNFSNYGRCVDISAPGDDILSSVSGNKYREMSGTSMSSPMVAGVVGLYLSLHPNVSPAEVISAISDGDSFVGRDEDETEEWNEEYGGRLNAAKVVGGSAEEVVVDDTLDEEELPSPTPEASVAPIPSPTPTPEPASSGGSDSGGGGGGGGDCCPGPNEDEESEAKKKVARGIVLGAKSVKPNLALVPKINSAFRQVFGRSPVREEHSYWLLRVQRGDKRTFGALVGAMRWQQALGRTYDPSPLRVVKSSVKTVVAGSLVSRINSIHRKAYGRNPGVSEHRYWMSRVVSGEKNSETALLGAMIWHRLAGISH